MNGQYRLNDVHIVRGGAFQLLAALCFGFTLELSNKHVFLKQKAAAVSDKKQNKALEIPGMLLAQHQADSSKWLVN